MNRMRINLIKPKYIGDMEALGGKRYRLYNLGRRTLSERTLKRMGFRLR